MSPEDRNDDSDGRESQRPRTKTGKSGKTKQGGGAADAGRGNAPGRAASDDVEPRQGAGSATAERPKRAATKRSSTRGTSEPPQTKATAPIPIDPQDELPPHGDPLMSHETTKAPRSPKARPAPAVPKPSGAELLPDPSD